jgi:hypothetical protein
MNKLNQFWKKNAFKILVYSSIIVIVICILLNRDSEGTWDTSYFYEPTSIKKPAKPAFVRESKGEIECKRVLEKIFQRAFPKKRPLFLLNNVTGKPLEIDCCCEEMKLGVEYNGKQHYEFVPGMHKNYEAFRNQQYRDEMKERLCKENNFTLITVPYTIPHEQIETYLIQQLTYHGKLI